MFTTRAGGSIVGSAVHTNTSTFGNSSSSYLSDREMDGWKTEKYRSIDRLNLADRHVYIYIYLGRLIDRLIEREGLL